MHGIEFLEKERMMYKTEMLRAIACRRKRDKYLLANEWKAKYSEMTYRALIQLARNHDARLKVAYWDLPNFESKRITASK